MSNVAIMTGGPKILEEGRQYSDFSNRRDSESADDASGRHIRLDAPDRPDTFKRSKSTKSVSEALRLAKSREEQETLMGEHEQADDDGCYPPRLNNEPRAPNAHAQLPVYATIHKIRRLVMASIGEFHHSWTPVIQLADAWCVDDPYSVDQLKSPRLNNAVVRPMVDHLYDPEDVSIVYCLLVNRVQFLREQSYQAHHQTVNITRANLCELIASRVLRRYDEDHEVR